MEYQWAVKVTMEYLDREGVVEDTATEVRNAPSERTARAMYESAADTLAHYAVRGHPKGQRLSSVELLRRPVGEWEAVA